MIVGHGGASTFRLGHCAQGALPGTFNLSCCLRVVSAAVCQWCPPSPPSQGPGPCYLLPVGHLPGGSAPTRRSICRSKRRRRRWQCACFTGNRVSWSLCRGPAPRLRADYIVLSHRPSSTRCREPRASRSDHAGRESASHREAPPRVGPDSRVETLDRPAQVPGWRRALVKLAPRMHHSTP